MFACREQQQESSQVTPTYPLSSGRHNDNAEVQTCAEDAQEEANDAARYAAPHAWAQPFPLMGGPALLNSCPNPSK